MVYGWTKNGKDAICPTFGRTLKARANQAGLFCTAIVTGHTRCKDLYLQQLRPPLKETLWWRGRSSENGYRLREKRRRNALESFYLREPFSISHYVSIR